MEAVNLRSTSGKLVTAKRCTSCGGFWLPKGMPPYLNSTQVHEYDVSHPSFTLKAFDMVCPNDQSLMLEDENADLPNGMRVWHCHDCGSAFFPKGQLGYYCDWQDGLLKESHSSGINRTQGAVTVLSILFLAIMVMASLNKVSVNYQAAVDQTLPTAGPNIYSLVFLALAYIAGTILAVLGRKLPLIIIGWGVISICILGFSVIIFGP